jgi:phage repressor protein C with HTH and peptisase S24 domain
MINPIRTDCNTNLQGISVVSLDDIIERLKKITKTKTNIELAKALKISESTVRSWKSRNKIPFEQCLEISDKYECSLDWLLKGDVSVTSITSLPEVRLLRETLKYIIDSHKGVKNFSHLTGIKEHVLYKFISGSIIPSREDLEIITEKCNEATNSNFDDEAFFENSTTKLFDVPEIPNNMFTSESNIPFYEVSASAGNGTLVENEELAHNISFRAEWLRKDLGVNPNDVFVMLTKGDSMDPTIKEDALIMVDKNTQKHINGIYVLRFNGELLVKRLQFTMSNTIKVISDNKAYDTEEINPEQLTGTDLEIIGRVVWSGQRM